jgi:hypothetical protein
VFQKKYFGEFLDDFGLFSTPIFGGYILLLNRQTIIKSKKIVELNAHQSLSRLFSLVAFINKSNIRKAANPNMRETKNIAATRLRMSNPKITIPTNLRKLMLKN